jgi:predicted nucleic acid-binding protein
VLVSALINPFGAPARVLDQVLRGTIQLAFDDRILDEYREVLRRPTFEFSRENVRALLDHIELTGVHVVPAPLASEGIPDLGDLPFAEVAAEIRAASLVTGNLKHFEFLQAHGIPVLTPDEFIRSLRSLLEEGNQ